MNIFIIKMIFLKLMVIYHTVKATLSPELEGYYPEDEYYYQEQTIFFMHRDEVAFFSAKDLACAITTYEPQNVFGYFAEHAID